MVIVVHAAGNQNVRALLRGLERAEMLSMFYTALAWRDLGPLDRLLPPRLRQELHRRSFDGIDARHISRFPVREIVRHLAPRMGLTCLVKHETGWASPYRVWGALDRNVAAVLRKAKQTARAVYAYEDGALDTFAAAAQIGMRRFYELPIGYWRAGLTLMEEERQLKPDWAPTMVGLRDSARVHERKDAELQAADHIIVPSTFVRDTLRLHPSITASIDVVPYGAPPPKPGGLKRKPHSQPLRLLYVGILTQRKGIAYLFEAMRQLRGMATLTLAGVWPEESCAALTTEIGRHDWVGRVTHDRVLDLMAEHDAFVLPSLFEGFALVILEAMAQGLPVIATPNSGAEMAIENGKEGFIIPIRDADAIARCVVRLAEDREQLAAMSAAALERAERMAWRAQEDRFAATIRRRLATTG